MKEVRLYLYEEMSLSILTREDIELPALGLSCIVVLFGFEASWDWDKEAGHQFVGYMKRELQVQWANVKAYTVTEEKEHESQG